MNVELYCCYSLNLRNFLRDNGMRLIYPNCDSQ